MIEPLPRLEQQSIYRFHCPSMVFRFTFRDNHVAAVAVSPTSHVVQFADEAIPLASIRPTAGSHLSFRAGPHANTIGMLT